MRNCRHCEKEMSEGYLNEDSSDTFCSIKCVEEFYGEELDLDLEDDNVFWTTWYEDE